MSAIAPRQYRSAYDCKVHYLYAVKPHLKLYGGMWHCAMASTLGWASPTFPLAWKEWFSHNQTSVHRGCAMVVQEYARARPRYNSMTLDQILASKGLQA